MRSIIILVFSQLGPPDNDDEAGWQTRSDNGLDKSARSERRANMTQLIAFSFKD